MPHAPTPNAGDRATQQPIAAGIIRALDDLAHVLDCLREHFSDPIDAFSVDAAGDTLRALADVHRPNAIPDADPEDDLL